MYLADTLQLESKLIFLKKMKPSEGICYFSYDSDSDQIICLKKKIIYLNRRFLIKVFYITYISSW